MKKKRKVTGFLFKKKNCLDTKLQGPARNHVQLLKLSSRLLVYFMGFFGKNLFCAKLQSLQHYF